MITPSFENVVKSARQAMAQGRTDEAQHLYEKALSAKPEAPELHYGLATALFMLNDLEGAAFHFKEVTRLDPLRAGAYINLGAVLNRLGEPKEAIQALRRGIQIDPRRAEGYYNLGLVYRDAGDPDRAAQAYQEALRLDANLSDAHFNLGNIHLEREHFTQAAECYRKALEQHPAWEKAERALAVAEEAIRAASPATSEPAPAAPEQPATPALDPDRRLDYPVHGPHLETLHEMIKSAQAGEVEFLRVTEEQVAPSVRELMTTLIGRRPGRPLFELAERVKKYEQAIEQFKKCHDEVQAHIRRAAEVGDKLMRL